MKNSRYLVTGCLIFLSFVATMAQRPDTTKQPGDTSGPGRGSGMSSLFADTGKLTSSDYQLQIEKTYVVFTNIDNKSDLGPAFTDIKEKLVDNDSILAVLKDNIINDAKALKLRNLQVFRTLMLNTQDDLKQRSELLDMMPEKKTKTGRSGDHSHCQSLHEV